MRVRIHRGTQEIGGSCVEVEHDGHRLVLDLGKPLTAGWNDHVDLPDVPGLVDGSDPLLHGVLLSHSHADHWGLITQVDPDVPRYVGEAGADILRAAAFWGLGTDLRETGHLRDREALHLGPFTVTPYLVDHSAYDAYALLIDAGGERLFYTGDFRSHGRKGALFQRLLDDPPHNIDVLLMEGTNVGPAGEPADKPLITETQVENDLAATLHDATGLVVVIGSAQNVDRLVTVYRAALRADRDLVVDAYSADVAEATHNPNIPKPGADWPRVRSYLPVRQKFRIKQAAEFDRAAKLKPHRIFTEQLTATPGHYVMYGAYTSEVAHLTKTGSLTHDGAIVWSLWDGYLTETSGQKLVDLARTSDIRFVQHHTSGHASPDDLAKLAAAIAPRHVVPIHTEHGDAFHDLTDHAWTHQDGDWWDITGDDEEDRRDHPKPKGDPDVHA